MIGRKLALVKNGQTVPQEHRHVFVPDLQKIRQTAIANAKRLEHAALVAVVRSYVKSLNFAKDQYGKLKAKIKELQNKNGNGTMAETGEVSKFLKMISDYKHKIREIKHKIREEEKNS